MNRLTLLPIIAIECMLTTTFACSAPSLLPERYGEAKFFQADPVPEYVTPVGNPLDWAGAKIGLDIRNFELPRAYENDYRFNCRFPIIDAVANNPLYMKQWTEDSAEEMLRLQSDVGPAVLRLASGWLIGGHFENPEYSWDEEALTRFDEALSTSPFSKKYRSALHDLYLNWLASSRLIEDAFSGLSEDDQTYFQTKPVGFLLPDDNTIAPLTGNTDTHLEYIAHLRQAKLDKVILAGEILATAITQYEWSIREIGKDNLLDKNATAFDRFTYDSDLGTLVITGFSDNRHEEDAAILIDFGGNDTYTNNAGGTNRNASVCIDHAGNDAYDANDRRYVQGCGLFGIGMLVDLAGDDHYTAKHFAQGAGIAGVGVLYDAAGKDIYSGHGFTQGAAMFGLGMLMDNAGDDSYDCATLSQGGATTMGMGVLSDLSGNDKYRLGTDSGKNAFNGLPGYGQGGALSFRHNPWRGHFTPYGGVGFLIDGTGDDEYVTTGWCDQGGSYIMSLGALYDGGGNDHYKANTGQGSGIHITNAILIDKSGDDHYEGAFRSGGSGGDRSPGILIDYAGNDTYQSGSSSYGTGVKPFSYSLMIDYSGDDNYITANPVGPILFNCWDSFGGVWPELAPNLWPYAIFLDLGGNDNYQVRNRENNSIRHSFGHGMMVDMEWDGGDVIGKVDNPLEQFPFVSRDYSIDIDYLISDPFNTSFIHIDYLISDPFNDSFSDSESRVRYRVGFLLRALHNPNLFIRFKWAGKIMRDSLLMGDLLSEVTTRRPLEKDSTQFNRDFLEILHTYLIEKRLPDSMIPQVGLLLSSPDPEVRTIIADDIGVFGLKSCEDALVRALDDTEQQVRRFSYRSLMALKSDKGLKKACVAVKIDSSEDVRRLALAYLSSKPSSVDNCPHYEILIDRLENDPASSVKVAAADGLGRVGNAKAIKLLRQATKFYDVYLQRAAAKALCELGEVEGIGVLIESLSFPSIDAFYNYDYNVPNFIATYAGYDLPEPDRFEQVKWREWFEANKDNIDLKENVAAARAYTVLTEKLRGTSDDEMIAMLEAFLKDHPNNRNASGTFAALLNRIAWDMATAPKDSPRFNPVLAIAYSKRSVELVDDPNYWDTLAEAYLKAGKMAESVKVCEEQLAKSPGTVMFSDRLRLIGEIKSEK